MESKLIFYPVIAQILLTLSMYLKLAIVKNRALAKGEVDLNRRALHGDAWPDYVMKTNNNLQNQFESPVLFYALCFMLWALGVVNIIGLSAAWGFVILRVVHAIVHSGSNIVAMRKKVFMVATALLAVLCVCAIYGILAVD